MTYAPKSLQPVARRVRVGEAQIFYQTLGAGPPLVLVHGLSGSGRWWRHNVPALAQQFQVHTVDLIGFGDSRGSQRFVLAQAAALLARWMEQLELGPVGLIGHSMGGCIAADLAASFPAQVDRLVLVDAAALPLGRNYVRHAGGLVGALRYATLNFWPVLLADAYRAGPLTLLAAAHQLLGTDISARLSDIQAPTLIVWGEYDRLVPLSLGEQLHASLPGSQLVVLPGAGHNAMWDRPAAFNRAVLEFLAPSSAQY